MTKSKLVRQQHAGKRPLMMGRILINRLYSYERAFFENGLPVLQGITFPLTKQPFEAGKMRLNEDAKMLGTPSRVMDARNLSYPLVYKRIKADEA